MQTGVFFSPLITGFNKFSLCPKSCKIIVHVHTPWWMQNREFHLAIQSKIKLLSSILLSITKETFVKTRDLASPSKD